MSAACDLLDVELALDRIDAELAGELPHHMRAFATAYARGSSLPHVPPVLREPATHVTLARARAHPVLADRALALARVSIPALLEDSSVVSRARAAAPTWDGYGALATARDVAARAHFGAEAISLLHRLAGVTIAAANATILSPIDHWQAPCEPLDVDAMWARLAVQHGAMGTVEIVRADVRPRAFVVEPRWHVIVVVPRVTTRAARFATLHELGHALAALLAPAGIPRVVDEAAAAYIARTQDHDELAERARRRRTQLAIALDAIERGIVETRPTTGPPWALWHDPAAQAAYVEAERIAERWWATFGPSAPAGALARAIAVEHARIDAATTL
ncbi:MAG TPA: hypothetical protein VK427_08120 [Kofleriaceae bacterium]|nr:hypothetical protein [Kofleriaceae bacterium]